MGEQPLPDLPVLDRRRSLLQRLIIFMQAPNLDESQRLLEADPDLLSEEADTLLKEFAALQEDVRALRMIEQSRTLLGRCRELGVSAAFTELQENHAQQVSDEFSTVLNNLCREVVDTLRSGNHDNQELLATAIDDIAAVSALEGLQDFLVLLADWLREKDIEHFASRVEVLRQDYKDTYRRMVALVAFTGLSNDDDAKE